MSPFLIATLIIWGCCLLLAVAISLLQVVKFASKPAKEVTKEIDDATSAVQEKEVTEEIAVASAAQEKEVTEEIAVASAVQEKEVTEEIAVTFAAQTQESAVEVTEGRVGFNANKMTFKEAYMALSTEQKKYFDDIRDYALAKKGAKLRETKVAMTVAILKKPILKLKIRRGITIASFKVESDVMRDFKRQAETTGGIREKETEIHITNDNIFEAACDMVDLMVKQYEQERLKARERLYAKFTQNNSEKYS